MGRLDVARVDGPPQSLASVVRVVDREVGRQADVFGVPPKQPSANTPRTIQVWVDNKTGLPVKYVLHSENERTTVTLTNIQANPNLPDDRFEIKLPSGVRTVEG